MPDKKPKVKGAHGGKRPGAGRKMSGPPCNCGKMSKARAAKRGHKC